jgi:hypothetical protein
MGRLLRGQAGFFDIYERLNELSAKGDDLENNRRRSHAADDGWAAGSRLPAQCCGRFDCAVIARQFLEVTGPGTESRSPPQAA